MKKPIYPYFIDIETTPLIDPKNEESINDNAMWHVYGNRFSEAATKEDSKASPFIALLNHWNNNAAFYAEFSKIICISIGIIADDTKLRVKTIAPQFTPGGVAQEITLLKELLPILDKAPFLCAHNGREFDFPFIQRRMLINDINLPLCLQTMGKKPWDVLNQDTIEMWAFGSYKHKASLEMLANSFGLPSPKQDMDGSMVRSVYYEPCPSDVLPFEYEKAKMERIGKYCAGDIVTLANVWMRIHQLPIIKAENIVYV